MKITLATPLALHTLAAMAGGKLTLRHLSEETTVTHICTDSREADGGTLFCAIRGERVDGHNSMTKAAELGGRVWIFTGQPATQGIFLQPRQRSASSTAACSE